MGERYRILFHVYTEVRIVKKRSEVVGTIINTVQPCMENNDGLHKNGHDDSTFEFVPIIELVN